MNISAEEMAERFRELSDEELSSRVGAGTLTPRALEIASLELRSRGIEPRPTAPGDGDFAPAHETTESAVVDLVTVANFSTPLKANVLRACLESHGIFAYVWGEHLGIAHIFLSLAGGGSRVQVRSDQVDQAREVLAAFERGELEIDEEPE